MSSFSARNKVREIFNSCELLDFLQKYTPERDREHVSIIVENFDDYTKEIVNEKDTIIDYRPYLYLKDQLEVYRFKISLFLTVRNEQTIGDIQFGIEPMFDTNEILDYPILLDLIVRFPESISHNFINVFFDDGLKVFKLRLWTIVAKQLESELRKYVSSKHGVLVFCSEYDTCSFIEAGVGGKAWSFYGFRTNIENNKISFAGEARLHIVRYTWKELYYEGEIDKTTGSFKLLDYNFSNYKI